MTKRDSLRYSNNKGNYNLPKDKVKDKVKDKGQKGFSIPKNRIQKLRERRSEPLVLSFEGLDRSIDAFNLGGVENKYYVNMIDRFIELCEITRDEFFGDEWHKFQPYEHQDLASLDYDVNFSDSFIEQADLIQFRLNKKNRVHCTIIGNVIFIIWLDFHHYLKLDENYSSKREKHERPLNSLEKMELELKKMQYWQKQLKMKNKKLEEDRDEVYEMLKQEWDSCSFCKERESEEDLIKIMDGLVCKDCLNKIKTGELI